MAAPLYTNFLAYDSTEASYWSSQVMATGTVENPVAANALHGSMCTLGFSRTTAAGVREDLALMTFHMWVNTGAGAYSQLNAADAAAAETIFTTMWTSCIPYWNAHIILSSYTWRDWGADFPLGKTGLSKPGPVWRVTPKNIAGSSAGTYPLPDQVAEAVTFRTASRRHWGRIFFPAMATGYTDTYGHIAGAEVTIICNAVNTAVKALNALTRQIDVVVWSPKYRGAFGIAEITMDDVFDVIRSRRAKQATFHQIDNS